MKTFKNICYMYHQLKYYKDLGLEERIQEFEEKIEIVKKEHPILSTLACLLP